MALPDYHDFTDEQNFGEVFQVFEEIRGSNEVPDVVITVYHHYYYIDRELPSNHFECPHTLSSAVIRRCHSDQRWPLFMARRACSVRTQRTYFGFRILEEMVRYTYTGRLHITRDNVCGVFHLALLWQMEKVVDWCASFIAAR